MCANDNSKPPFQGASRQLDATTARSGALTAVLLTLSILQIDVATSGAFSRLATPLGETQMCGGHAIPSSPSQISQIASPSGQENRWTVGKKTLLYIRVNFTDATSEPISKGEAEQAIGQANAFFLANSYGLFSLEGAVTPLLTMPQAKSNYFRLEDNRIWWTPEEVLDDARQAARSAGFDTAKYDLDCVRFDAGFSTGRANLGAKGAWLGASTARQLCHELGHNLGLQHANAWRPDSENIFGDGRSLEYGNPYDVMGGEFNTALGHFCAFNKNLLGWLPPGSVLSVTNAAVKSLWPIDKPVPSEKVVLALRVRNAKGSDYWIEHRSLYPSLTNGVLIYWSPWVDSDDKTLLLMTENDPLRDGVLQIGTTLYDPGASVAFVPVRKLSERLELAVLFGNLPSYRLFFLPSSEASRFLLLYSGDPMENAILWRAGNLLDWRADTAVQRTDSNGLLTFEVFRTLRDSHQFYRLERKN